MVERKCLKAFFSGLNCGFVVYEKSDSTKAPESGAFHGLKWRLSLERNDLLRFYPEDEFPNMDLVTAYLVHVNNSSGPLMSHREGRDHDRSGALSVQAPTRAI